MKKDRPLIAVVDDEVSIRKALRRLIQTWDMRVETFESGQAFLDSLAAEHPDCVILDVHMPGLTGIEVQHEIVRRGLTFPVIAITGYDKADIRSQCLAAGAIAYLNKPLDEAPLFEAVTRALQRGSPQPADTR